MALLTILSEDRESQADLEWTRFKMMAIAMHPEHGEQILALDEDSETRMPVTDEEALAYIPIQERPEKNQLLEDLKNLGFALRD